MRYHFSSWMTATLRGDSLTMFKKGSCTSTILEWFDSNHRGKLIRKMRHTNGIFSTRMTSFIFFLFSRNNRFFSFIINEIQQGLQKQMKKPLCPDAVWLNYNPRKFINQSQLWCSVFIFPTSWGAVHKGRHTVFWLLNPRPALWLLDRQKSLAFLRGEKLRLCHKK